MNRRTFFKGWAFAALTALIGSRTGMSEQLYGRNSVSKQPTALELFRPTPSQEEAILAMSSGKANELLCVGGNRSGKQVLGAICVTAMVTGKPITMRDGTKVFIQPWLWSGREARILLVGYDWRHQKHSIQRSLFEPKLFRVIRDKSTGEIRSYDPGDTRDTVRYDETASSPPLMSMRDLSDVVWENKRDRVLMRCTVAETKTILEFASSATVRPQCDLDAVWIDEQLYDDIWYPELLVQLANRNGTMLWTTWPHSNSPQLGNAVDRANRGGLTAYVRMRTPFHRDLASLYIGGEEA